MRNACAQNAKQIAEKKFTTKGREKEHKTYTGIITFMCTY
jgi:hypothetical protein